MAHKTVEDKKTTNNCRALKSIKRHESEDYDDFIGKKRELKKKYNGRKKVHKVTESNKISYCLNCNWKFPERMSMIRRNNHINRCYEGYGRLDIMRYNEEQKLKLYRNYPDKKIVDLAICPICGKQFGSENCKSKQNHLHCCSKLSLIK